MDADQRRALARVYRETITPELAPLGFSRVGRSGVWLRSAGAISHAVSTEYAHGSWTLRRDIVFPAAGEIMNGRPCRPEQVAWSGIISGGPDTHTNRDVLRGFSTADIGDRNFTETSRRIALTVRDLAVWASRFQTPADVIEYLLGPDPVDIGITIPVTTAARKATAAAVAAADGAVDAIALVEAATTALAAWPGAISDGRIARMRAALEAQRA